MKQLPNGLCEYYGPAAFREGICELLVHYFCRECGKTMKINEGKLYKDCKCNPSLRLEEIALNISYDRTPYFLNASKEEIEKTKDEHFNDWKKWKGKGK